MCGIAILINRENDFLHSAIDYLRIIWECWELETCLLECLDIDLIVTIFVFIKSSFHCNSCSCKSMKIAASLARNVNVTSEGPCGGSW